MATGIVVDGGGAGPIPPCILGEGEHIPLILRMKTPVFPWTSDPILSTDRTPRMICGQRGNTTAGARREQSEPNGCGPFGMWSIWCRKKRVVFKLGARIKYIIYASGT
jgi:hypothetical protein